jgi:hypothetical protein
MINIALDDICDCREEQTGTRSVKLPIRNCQTAFETIGKFQRMTIRDG